MGDERGRWVPTRWLERSNPCSVHEVLLSISSPTLVVLNIRGKSGEVTAFTH